jgi:predicted ribosome quality control (RQC) complex YloA/Tae2 family protein
MEGTIFETKDRMYIARCGDAANPCNLNIKLFAGEYGNLDYLVHFFRDSVQIHKENIIRHKLDTLFNYVDEKKAVAIFKKEFADYTESNVFFEELSAEYSELRFSEERAEKIRRKQEEIARIQENMQELNGKYRETGNEELFRDAMYMYIKELVPEVNNLRLLKYKTTEMVDADSAGADGQRGVEVKQLYQTEYNLEDLDFTFGSFPKVIRFRS